MIAPCQLFCSIYALWSKLWVYVISTTNNWNWNIYTIAIVAVFHLLDYTLIKALGKEYDYVIDSSQASFIIIDIETSRKKYLCFIVSSVQNK